MKRSCAVLAVFVVAIAATFGPRARAQNPPAHRAIWAPIGDQWAQYGLLVLRDLPAGHPEFRVGPPANRYLRDPIRQIIRSSLDPAHRRGIRIIDVMFFFDEGMFVGGVPRDPGGNPDPNIQGLCDISADWVEAVEDFNRTCQRPGCEPLALRLRLASTAVPMSYFRLTDPARYPELPVSLEDYRALVIDENGQTTRTSEVLDLGQEVIRRHVGIWVERILERVELLAPGTEVEMLTLALDGGGETSLFSSRGITGFTNMAGYTDSPSHVRFFRERQAHLRSTIVAFGEAVRRYNAARARDVGAGVFYQSWVLDDTMRGAFDLHELLEGVPVTTLHHTVWPRNVFDPANRGLSETQHRMIVAPSATAASRLGLALDTEFSWPWYYPTGTFFSGGFYRWVNAGGFGGPWGTHHVGDVDGDRRADLLFVERADTGVTSVHVALSNGSGFVPSGRWLAAAEPGDLIGIADFDGDRRDDLLHLRRGLAPALDSLWVSLSTNEGGIDRFAAPRQWSAPGAFGGRWGRYHVGDFSGDGRADLLFLEPSDHTIHVSLSSGTGFHAPGSGRWAGPGEFGGAWGRYHLGDFNGDGREDLLFLEPSDHSLHVSLSTGTAFFGPGSGRWIGPGGFGGTWGRHYVGDFDGDGDDDLMFVEPTDDSVHVALSNGATFLYGGVWADPNHFGEDPDRYFAADFNGPEGARGRADLGYLTTDGEFYMAAAYSFESGVYNAHLRSDDNARSFLAQARAGLKFGATGMTYANWTTGDVRVPPATDAWRAIIGPVPADDEHLHGPGGLFEPPQTTPLPAARRAIYISTLGKMRCQEEPVSSPLSCRFPDYLRWFDDFGLTAELRSRQVDILSDRMVITGSLSRYDTIYLPYETALVMDDGACTALVTKHRNVRRQTSKHGRVTIPLRICP